MLGVKLISVTDHNTLEAYKYLPSLADQAGITVLPGVEIDCIFESRDYHLLGYGVNPFDIDLNNMLNISRSSLEEMSERLISLISQDDDSVSSEDYASYTYNSSRGGWKGLNYLIDRGLTEGLPSAMEFYSRYNVSYESCTFPSLAQACNIVHSAGGFCILAHPGEFFPDDKSLYRSLSALVNQGVEGLECYYPSHTLSFTNRCLNFCKRNNLFITCGGDSHGNFSKVICGVNYSIGAASVDSSILFLKDF